VSSNPPKLVLCVIDAMAPAMLERAVAAGAAPVLATLIERGRYVPDCVAAFPSVTPVCAASIVTGVAQDEHRIPGMNWFHREEHRYVEYGSSFRAAQRFGIARQLTDTVYNMNRAHLSRDADGVRDARRRRRAHRRHHLPDVPRAPPPRAPARHRADADRRLDPDAPPGDGPARAVLRRHLRLAADRLPLGQLGMPGVRDRHSGCVSAYLVEHDLFDFLLLSLPDNDWYSHKYGPDAQVQSIAQADLQLARVMNASGGVDEFLSEHAVIVMADHSQTAITDTIALQDELAELGVRGPSRSTGARAEKSRASPSVPLSAPRWSTRCTRPSATRCAPRS
jgi:predicted AlkP superfamily pyrophosphatase or phosphodiesterase